MIFIRIDENIAERTARMMMITNFSLPLQALNQILQTYLSCQQITVPFFYANILSFFIALFFGRQFIIIDNYREIGFCYTRIVQEFFNCTFSICVMIFMANRESLMFPTFNLVFGNFVKYAKLCVKTSIAFYGENIAFELNTYLAARLGSVSELAAFITITNCMLPIFYMSIGLANTFRTNIGNMLGAGEIERARYVSKIYILYVIIFALIINALVEFFCKNIAILYTGGSELYPKVMTGIRIYYLDIFPSFMLYSQNSVLRFLNKNNQVIMIGAFLMPALVGLFSLIFGFKMKMGTLGLVLSFSGTKIIIIAIFFYMIYSIDWVKNYLDFKKKTQDEEKNDIQKALKN